MEENEYRETYSDVNALPCIFERAVLVRSCNCEHARRLYLAEREAIGCNSIDANIDCSTLLDLWHEQSRFVLRQTNTDAPLPHGKELRVQCGGLQGLAQVIGHSDTKQPIANVYALVRRIRERFGEIKSMPMQEVIQAIARFQPRRRRRPPSKP